MNDEAPSEGSFFMPHPGTGDMIPLTKTSMTSLPLARFFKEAYYRLPDGTFDKVHRIGGTSDHALRDQYFDDLQNILI